MSSVASILSILYQPYLLVSGDVSPSFKYFSISTSLNPRVVKQQVNALSLSNCMLKWPNTISLCPFSLLLLIRSMRLPSKSLIGSLYRFPCSLMYHSCCALTEASPPDGCGPYATMIVERTPSLPRSVTHVHLPISSSPLSNFVLVRYQFNIVAILPYW